MAQYASTTASESPSQCNTSDELTQLDSYINLQIFVPELQLQKCLTVSLDELVWDIKRKLFAALPQVGFLFVYGLCDFRPCLNPSILVFFFRLVMEEPESFFWRIGASVIFHSMTVFLTSN